MSAFIANPIALRSIYVSPTPLSTLTVIPWEHGGFSVPSTLLIAKDAMTTVLPSGETFAPIIPEASTFAAFGAIVLLSALAVWVWANQVVPVSRTNLALSKRQGPVKDYLDELRMAGKDSQPPGSLDNESLESTSSQAESVATSRNSRALERWIFTDWLQNNKSAAKPGRQKEPALPILRNAKWNSGDNPVLVASALILGGVVFSAITERVGSLMV